MRLGATETIQDNLHPKWVTSLELRYYFERTQRLRVDVYDRDGPAADLSRHDFIGWASITVPELVRSSGQRVELPLRNERRGGANGGVGVVRATSGANGGGGGANATAPKVTSKNGFITIRAEEVSALKQTVTLDFGVTRLRRGMLASLSKSRPHLVLSRALEDGAWLRVHRSAGGTPTATRGEYRFPRHVMSFEKLCRCDEGVPLRVDVLYERSGKETVVASTVLSLRRLIGAKSVALAAAGKPAGELIVHGVSVTAEHSFLDYIIGGCEVSLIVAIDFTASNGDPVRPGTLHYRDPARPNEYEAATRAVGDILANYDSDQRFPAFGFGAKLPPDYRAAQHCFSLTGDVNPVCEGVDGILDCYRETLFNVRLSGPTVFAEIVRTAALYASTNVSQAEQKYTILLIITDGVVNDMAATKEAIIHASALPLSIVIVGVGDADFSDMNLLDGDDRPLGPGMSRDIVQFVPYRQFRDFPEILASRVLEEVPTQLLDYMKSQRLVPNPPVPFDPAAVASPAALRAAAGATQSPLPPSPVTVPPSVPPQYRYGPAGLMMAAGGAPVGGGGDPYGGLLGSQGAQLFGGPAAAGGGVAAGGPPQPPVPPGHPYGGGPYPVADPAALAAAAAAAGHPPPPYAAAGGPPGAGHPGPGRPPPYAQPPAPASPATAAAGMTAAQYEEHQYQVYMYHQQQQAAAASAATAAAGAAGRQPSAGHHGPFAYDATATTPGSSFLGGGAAPPAPPPPPVTAAAHPHLPPPPPRPPAPPPGHPHAGGHPPGPSGDPQTPAGGPAAPPPAGAGHAASPHAGPGAATPPGAAAAAAGATSPGWDSAGKIGRAHV